jgi:hypothetical protein
MLCFGDFWLEGDGDQVLFDLINKSANDDPPVIYYAHEGPLPKTRVCQELR